MRETIVRGRRVSERCAYSGTAFHCVKSVQIPSYFWSVFFPIRTRYGDLLPKSLYSVLIQENTDQK